MGTNSGNKVPYLLGALNCVGEWIVFDAIQVANPIQNFVILVEFLCSVNVKIWIKVGTKLAVHFRHGTQYDMMILFVNLEISINSLLNKNTDNFFINFLSPLGCVENFVLLNCSF